MTIDRSFFYSLEHYEYGEAFYGSWKSVYYRLAMEPLKNVRFVPVEKRDPCVLRATVWPGPKAYSVADESVKTHKDFPYTEEGLEEAVLWIDSHCEGAEELRIMG